MVILFLIDILICGSGRRFLSFCQLVAPFAGGTWNKHRHSASNNITPYLKRIIFYGLNFSSRKPSGPRIGVKYSLWTLTGDSHGSQGVSNSSSIYILKPQHFSLLFILEIIWLIYFWFFIEFLLFYGSHKAAFVLSNMSLRMRFRGYLSK